MSWSRSSHHEALEGARQVVGSGWGPDRSLCSPRLHDKDADQERMGSNAQLAVAQGSTCTRSGPPKERGGGKRGLGGGN